MVALPDPLVPADVDLREFGYMPLDVRRLRDSRIAAMVSGDEFRAAVLLWCAAWHQVPAASLPNDDIELAQLAGFGRVLREWRKVKAGALSGWILCTDGRLYHPVVAEKARESWKSKNEHEFRRECDRIRKENKRLSEKGLPIMAMPELAEWLSTKVSAGIPAENRNFPAENDLFPAENALKVRERKGEVMETKGTKSKAKPKPRSKNHHTLGDNLGSAKLEKSERALTSTQDQSSARASRLPADWRLPNRWGLWAQQEKNWNEERVRAVAAAFRDHWVAASGPSARKHDWEATWRNWCRREGTSINCKKSVTVAEQNREVLDRFVERGEQADATIEGEFSTDHHGKN